MSTEQKQLPIDQPSFGTCEHCGQQFNPRKHGGGSRQRFCSLKCRTSWHTAQRSPACTLETVIVGPPPPEPQTNAPEATVLASLESDPEFDWDDPETVVLREQPETAVYWNPKGELVIRQRRDYPDEDQFIYIAAANVDSFIDKLTDIAGIPSVP